MRIVVIGPGAMGCLLAASLAGSPGASGAGSENHNGLWLLDHRRQRAGLLARQGLILEEQGRQFHYRIPVAVEAAEIGPADIILLCVKSHQVRQALGRAGSLLTRDSLLVGLQNGIGHLAILQEQIHACVVAVGVSAQGATLLAPGHVRHAGQGLTRIGFLLPAARGAAARLKAAAALLTAAGIPTETVDDIMEHVWAKLFVNVGINALTALLGCPNGGLLASPQALARLSAAVREAEAVARALGIKITSDPLAYTLAVCSATSANISSMLQDVRGRRKTEIDAINGALVEKARALGIPVPVNAGLVAAVKELEREYQAAASQT
jgi:2-dehydropantoate 2-reductase